MDPQNPFLTPESRGAEHEDSQEVLAEKAIADAGQSQALYNYNQKLLEQKERELMESIALNYGRIREVERELGNLQLQLKLTSGPKKHALELLRKKIEAQNERVAHVRARHTAAKATFEKLDAELKREEAVKDQLCGELNTLVQQAAKAQMDKLEELKVTLEGLYGGIMPSPAAAQQARQQQQQQQQQQRQQQQATPAPAQPPPPPQEQASGAGATGQHQEPQGDSAAPSSGQAAAAATASPPEAASAGEQQQEQLRRQQEQERQEQERRAAEERRRREAEATAARSRHVSLASSSGSPGRASLSSASAAAAAAAGAGTGGSRQHGVQVPSNRRAVVGGSPRAGAVGPGTGDTAASARQRAANGGPGASAAAAAAAAGKQQRFSGFDT